MGKFKYDEFKWELYSDLSVVELLHRMELGYTKYCCFLCEWDSRYKKNHYVNKLWTKRTSLTPGEKKAVSPPLVLPEKIFLPLSRIKLGLMKYFVKGMDKTSRGFEYLRNKFPNVSDTNIGNFSKQSTKTAQTILNLCIWCPSWNSYSLSHWCTQNCSTMLWKTCQNIWAHILLGNSKNYSLKRNKIYIRIKLLIYISILRCTSHQPILAADLGWSINRVKPWTYQVSKTCVF